MLKKICFVLLIIILASLGVYYLISAKQPQALNLNTLPPYKQNNSIIVLESYINLIKSQSVLFEIFAQKDSNIEAVSVSLVSPNSNKVYFQSEVKPQRYKYFVSLDNKYCDKKNVQGLRFIGSTGQLKVKKFDQVEQPIFYITYKDKSDNQVYYSKNTSGGFCTSLTE